MEGKMALTCDTLGHVLDPGVCETALLDAAAHILFAETTNVCHERGGKEREMKVRAPFCFQAVRSCDSRTAFSRTVSDTG